MVREYRLELEPAEAEGLDLEQLNDEQRRAVTSGDGPLLIIAGPGSGKTRTLTYRLARLISRGCPGDRIALLTFTNRAAREMLARARSLVGAAVRPVWGGTFHSVALRILRREATRLGYPADFSVIDRDDASTLMRQCIADLPERPRDKRFPRPSTLVNLWSRCVNTDADVAAVLTSEYPQFAPMEEAVCAAIAEYQSRKLEYGAMDFDDLLLLLRRLLVEDAEAREKYASKFLHVLVDEYQDTNRLQAEIVDALASEHGNLAVVGDDAQAIYSFRGADYENILRFPDRYPACDVVKLEQNYRSSPQILALANTSIRHNTRRFDKELAATRPDGPLPALVPCRDEAQQATFVAQRLLELRDEGVALDSMAILYRAHRQSMQLQVELGRRNIPFIIRSGLRFFEQRHLKDVLAFLRLAQSPRDALAFQRAAMLADGIGIKTAEKLREAAGDAQTLAGALRNIATAAPSLGRGAEGWRQIRTVLETLAGDGVQRAPAVAIDAVRGAFYDAYLELTFDNAQARARDLDTLATYAEQFDSIDRLLDEITLAGSPSGVDVLDSDKPDEHVILSSVHQAKGLEFHAVFVIWMSEDHFPIRFATGDDESVEEERRLFYVAVTRAKRELYLTWPMLAHERRTGMVVVRRSPFIEELSAAPRPIYEEWRLSR